MDLSTNSPSCPYCQGQDVPNCYCVVRMTFTLPAPYDSHVQRYDAEYVGKAYRDAKKAGNLLLAHTIKAGLNCYLLPFAELRRSLQRVTFNGARP